MFQRYLVGTWVLECPLPFQSFSGGPSRSRCRPGPAWTSWQRRGSHQWSREGWYWGCGGSRTLRSPSRSASPGSPLKRASWLEGGGGGGVAECETLQVVRRWGGRKASGRCVLITRRLPLNPLVNSIGSAKKDDRSWSTCLDKCRSTLLTKGTTSPDRGSPPVRIWGWSSVDGWMQPNSRNGDLYCHHH